MWQSHYCSKSKQKSRREQEYTFTRTPCYAWRNARSRRCSKRWTDQVSTLKMCQTCRELQGLDGEPIDFEWKIFPRATALVILHEIQATLQGKHITPENFGDRIIFMSMFNDIILDKRGDEDSCALTSRKIKEYASKFTDGHRAFLGPGEESKRCQGYSTTYHGKWIFVLFRCWKISRIQDTQYSKG